MSDSQTNRRILVVDDNPSIHDDFQKLLAADALDGEDCLAKASAALFGESPTAERPRFELSSAYQGQEALSKVRSALTAGGPFALAFVDVRMPPGWDGVETTARLWEADPELQVVICTAFSDYSWQEITQRLGASDRLVILKKPFDAVEVLQLANVLSEKWRLTRAGQQKLRELDLQVREGNRQLELQATALQAAANGIVITDATGKIVWHNPAFSRLTGYSGTELVGSSTALFKSGKHDREFYQRLWSTISAGQVWAGEMVNRRKDGSLYTSEMTITPVRGQSGATTHYVAIQQDLSIRCELESQLRQAQKMEAVGQLAGGVAHDFNNMLAVIRGNADLLLMHPGQFKPQGLECLKQISCATDRAAALTRQLLAFSRKQVLDCRPLDLCDVISDLTKMLKRIIGETIALECQYAGKLPRVEADIGMLEQILVNLVVNARDAMPAGGKLIIRTESVELGETSASSHAEARPGRYVCLSVTDTGTGIAPEHLALVFDPFFTTKEPGHGTGLGLSTVYGIAKQHKGWVEVSSKPGAGARFSVFLPVSSNVGTDRSNGTTPTATDPEPPGGSEAILLVEDDESVRAVIRRVLEGAGYKVVETSNASEALTAWEDRDSRFELLLTDVILPGRISGLELAMQLRQSSREVGIVFLSGYARDVLSKDPGFLGRFKFTFLQKPVSSRGLLQAVRRSLDEAKSTMGAG